MLGYDAAALTVPTSLLEPRPSYAKALFATSALLAVSCGSPPQPENARVTGPVFVASARYCTGEFDERIEDWVKNDADELSKLFASANLLDTDPTPERVENAAGSKNNSRGLFFFYSGHGTLVGNRGATLCLSHSSGARSDGKLPVQDLFPKFHDNSSPWKVIVLNTCKSAYIDLRNAPQRFSVITVAHDDVLALGSQGRLTFIGEHAASVIRGSEDKGGPDLNCDGILTDYELFRAIVAAVPNADDASPNLQQRSQAHLPLPLDGTPVPARRCADENVTGAIRMIADDLAAKGDPLAQTLRAQLSFAKKLAVATANRSDLVLPSSVGDYFIVEPRDSRILASLAGSRLRNFPGSLRNAEKVARFAISTEIYRFERSSDWVRVVRLRNGEVIRKVLVAELSAVVSNLEYRAVVAVRNRPSRRDGEVLVRFIPEPDPRNSMFALEIEPKYRAEFRVPDQLVWSSSPSGSPTWTSVPCDPQLDGQCFRQYVAARGAP